MTSMTNVAMAQLIAMSITTEVESRLKVPSIPMSMTMRRIKFKAKYCEQKARWQQ